MFSVIHYCLDSIPKVEGLHSSHFLWNLISEKKKNGLLVASLNLTRQVFEDPYYPYPQISFLEYRKFTVDSLQRLFSINPSIKGVNM